MFVRLTKSSAAGAAALAVAGVMLAPAVASAQTYSYQGAQDYRYSQPYQQPYGYDRYDDRSGYGYNDIPDYCRSDRNQRTAAGGVVGGALGAIAGSQMGANGRRTEASVLGGLLGAAVGAGVGRSSAGNDCDRYYDQSRYAYDDRYGSQTYDDRYDDRGYGSSYDRTYEYERSTGYAQPYGYQQTQPYGYQQTQPYGYDPRYASDQRYADQYGCRTVETRSRTRDGRLVTRYEQSCPDRY